MLRIHHAGLTVADLGRSLRFWCDGLGFEVLVEQEKEGGYLEAITGERGAHTKQAHLGLPGSDVRIELLQYLEPPATPIAVQPREPGGGHVALVCPDLPALLERVVRAGGEPFSPPVTVDSGANRGALAVYVRDPDMHIVELIQPAR